MKNEKPKSTVKSTKMFDILANKNEDQEKKDLTFIVEQAQINTQQEVLEIKKQISNQNELINALMYDGKNFSISKLYAAETQLALLEKKLDWINNRTFELF